ncbi:MAG: hypothetical protein K0Q87_5278, partial [Neobacillus sp.]|nr:hypothetical protein [Neobacillus sp.]
MFPVVVKQQLQVLLILTILFYFYSNLEKETP